MLCAPPPSSIAEVSSKTARRRVLHVLGRMQRGGAEMCLIEVMRHLCPSEFHADICVLSGLPGVLDASVRACGGAIIPIKLDLRFPPRFIRVLRQQRYDVVHSHVLHTSGAILALAAAAGVPRRIAHIHGMHDGRPSTWRRHLQRNVMLRLIDRYATDIAGCGEGAMDAIWRADWKADSRCRIVHNSVDPARFELSVGSGAIRAALGFSTSALVFLHVGNEVAEKNHERLLSIFAEINRQEPSSRLILVGAGTDDAAGISRRVIDRLRLTAAVKALGARGDVPQLLRAADVLLLPSLREGLPAIVLEACVSGVPVLATDLPGVREIARRLVLVRYLPLSAADADWAAAALRLPDEASRLRLRATAAETFRASVFHIDRAVDAYRLLWNGAKHQRADACS